MRPILIQAVLVLAVLSFAAAVPLACVSQIPPADEHDADESADGPSTAAGDSDSAGTDGGLPVGFESDLFTVVSRGVIEIGPDVQMAVDDNEQNEQTLLVTDPALGVTETIDCGCPPTRSGGCKPDSGGCKIDINSGGKADCVGGCEGSPVTCPSCDWVNLTTNPDVTAIGEPLP